MNSSAAMEVWVELAEIKDESGNFVRDNNGSIELTYKLDESSAFTKKLERSKQTFLANKMESNTWNFYYNYNILYRLRYRGEEAYLLMTKVRGFLSCFSDFYSGDYAKVICLNSEENTYGVDTEADGEIEEYGTITVKPETMQWLNPLN